MAAPLFICGCGHSGTSLVANMFAANPYAYVPLRETEVFLDPHRAAKRYRALLAELKRSGRRHLVEKTPRHVRMLDLIRSIEPRARFLIMVRDGRDVAASFVKRYGSAEPGIVRWIEENTIVVREMTAPDVFVLRYEDLVATPKGQLQSVCEFARLPFAEEMLEYHQQKRHWFGETELRKGDGRNGAEHRALRNWQINQPLFDGRGTWKQVVAEPALDRLLQRPARQLMEALGYL